MKKSDRLLNQPRLSESDRSFGISRVVGAIAHRYLLICHASKMQHLGHFQKYSISSAPVESGLET